METTVARNRVAAPGTLVQVQAQPARVFGASGGPGRTAAGLSAVLPPAAEQVSQEKLALFHVASPLDLKLLALAIAFREDDDGLVGDVFEWSLMMAINHGDNEINQMIVDALQLVRVQVTKPQAVLVAAEAGRLVSYSPTLPANATLATGRRGRPPYVTNLVAGATTKSWKADLLLGEQDRWVAASLKSNPLVLSPSLASAASTPHPPRIGITATSARSSGVMRDPKSGVVVVKVPVDTYSMDMSKRILDEVIKAFKADLNVPDSPMRRGSLGISEQLNRWRHWTVGDALAKLDEVAGEQRQAFTANSQVLSTGADVEGAAQSLVAMDPLTKPEIPLSRVPSLYNPSHHRLDLPG